MLEEAGGSMLQSTTRRIGVSRSKIGLLLKSIVCVRRVTKRQKKGRERFVVLIAE